jgi:NAD(P)-dependent dehydrogenase (short-subunit alcohol dehydrogenase family)
VADAGRRLDVVFANAAAIAVARIGEVMQEHLQKALPPLNDGGSIILNSSITNAKGNDGSDVYAAIMAALRSLGPAWESELRERKIRVNVIGPDATETPGIDALASRPNPGPNTADEFENYQRGIVPLVRYATAGEVANAALFLASELGSLPTGADIAVDRGVKEVGRCGSCWKASSSDATTSEGAVMSRIPRGHRSVHSRVKKASRAKPPRTQPWRLMVRA